MRLHWGIYGLISGGTRFIASAYAAPCQWSRQARPSRIPIGLPLKTLSLKPLLSLAPGHSGPVGLLLVMSGMAPDATANQPHFRGSVPPCGVSAARRRFPPSNLARVPGPFSGGFPAPRKNFRKSSRTPLRRRGRFGILLTRCAGQGESPCGARRRSLKTDELKVKENCNVTR